MKLLQHEMYSFSDLSVLLFFIMERTEDDHEEASDMLYKKLGQQRYDKLVQDMKIIAEKFKIRQNR